MKSKLRLLITIFPLVILSAGMGLANAALDHVVWRDYEEGIAFAKKTNKPIMIAFLSDRCRYCDLMEKKTFSDREVVRALNEKFVSIKVDVSRNAMLARMYGATYLPTTIFITPQEEGIGKLIGYRSPNDFLLVLEFVGDGFYQRMSFEDFLRMKGKRKK
jgi:thioredoxin-related protein